MIEPSDPGAEMWRTRLAQLVVDGGNLHGLVSGPQPDARDAFRKKYLQWHNEVVRTVAERTDGADVDRFSSTLWQLVVGGRVADDELVRTILTDVEIAIGWLRRMADEAGQDRMVPPPAAVAQPSTVGMAVYDANCLFSKHTRYLLLAFAVHGVVQARWSRRLLKEVGGNLAGQLRGDSLEDLGRWMKAEAVMVRDGLVGGYDRWLDQVALPDPGDCHVLAAAIEAGATMIVTRNLRHFPAEELARFGIHALGPDEFASECLDANPVLAARIVADHPDPERFLNRLDIDLPTTAARLHELVS